MAVDAREIEQADSPQPPSTGRQGGFEVIRDPEPSTPSDTAPDSGAEPTESTGPEPGPSAVVTDEEDDPLERLLADPETRTRAFRRLVDDREPDEVLAESEKLRKWMDGRAGSIASRQSDAAIKSQQALWEARGRAAEQEDQRQRVWSWEDTELERLNKDDPLAAADFYGKVTARRRQERERIETEAKRSGQIHAVTRDLNDHVDGQIRARFVDPIAKRLAEELPDVAAELHAAGRYGHIPAYFDRVSAYLTEAETALAGHDEKKRIAAEKDRRTAERARESAIRKDALATVNAGDNPDTGGGNGAGGKGGIELAQYKAMPIADRLLWKKTHKAEYDAMFTA